MPPGICNLMAGGLEYRENSQILQEPELPKFLHTADWQMGRAFTRFETEDGAALVESVWTRAQRLGAVPGNVHLALQPRVINLEPQGLSILCAPEILLFTCHPEKWQDLGVPPVDIQASKERIS